ncbi:MAG TPA: hypothetical protein DDZ80_22550, partial [Cyanobacteria bacterium UBA8803]|nr:hypothetical protein [Cyanobacteria bacterium UBA8803]
KQQSTNNLLTMPLSTSAIRRYTPPTCTLEIVAKTSPLSQWVGQTLFKDLRFELRFDDPRHTDDKRITIRGDRNALDSLCDAVTNYVQDFLNSSPAPLALAMPNAVSDSSAVVEDGNLPLSLSGVKYSQSVMPPLSENAPEPSDASIEADAKPQKLPDGIYLKPKGLVAHQLFLGLLANEESGQVVNLSSLQLFDLATALDEYTAEVIALPNLNRSRTKKAPPAWTWAAAAVVLAVGVTSAGVKLRNQSQSNQQAAAPIAGAPANQTGLAPNTAQVPPTPTTLVPPPPSPIPTPTVPVALSPAPTLSPPGPVKAPTAPTNNAPPVAQGSNAAPQRSTISIDPGTAQRPARQSAPKVPAPPRVATRPVPPPIPGDPVGASSGANTAPTQTSVGKVPAEAPALPPGPSLKRRPSSPDVTAEVAPPAATRGASSPENLTSADSAAANDGARGRLFDIIPQVAEARNYLQQRWQPPADLTSKLEYSVWLNSDGSIERILPLGQAAQTYIDRTNIPLVGKQFVSPIEGGAKPRIRVVLSPDGQVETLLEGVN